MDALVRNFNTAGPCRVGEHYMLPPLQRLPEIQAIIDEKNYFVLHAARQVGKTTMLRTLAQELTREGRYLAVILSLEVGAAFPRDVGKAESAILSDWRSEAQSQLPPELRPPPWPEGPEGGRIADALATWASTARRPLVVFLDEVDSLQDEVLISVLRQLRSGFARRPGGFPWSLGLCGMRDVRDYKVMAGGRARLYSPSPFTSAIADAERAWIPDIKVDSLTLRLFRRDETAALYEQHTADTGQVFLPEAIDAAMRLSGGHPWLVNALARHITKVLCTNRGAPITAEHMEKAKEALILRRDTHLDSLMERLREERVRRIVEPILLGAQIPMDVLNDDLLYVRDLGLITEHPGVRIANAIYQEIIPRALTYVMQAALVQETSWYLRPDGSLDMILLLAAFQEFFAQHSEAWLGRYDYREAGPHLMLMAFLQRIVNGGGRISREFAVGSGRADLVVDFGGCRSVLELKLRAGPATQAEGVAQLCAYLERLDETEGHLVLFDRRRSVRWADKIFIQEVAGPTGQRIHVFGA